MNLSVRLFSVTVRTTCSGAIRDVGLDLEGDLDLSSYQPDQVSDHLVGDPAGIPTDARRVERNGAMEPPRAWRGERERRRLQCRLPLAESRRS